jgi:hypothetical protein
MKKSLTILLAVASALIVAAFVGVAFAQNVNAQIPTANVNSQVPPCVSANIGVNAPPCWSNSANAGYCNTNQYCQNQGCVGIGANNQAQIGYGRGLGMLGRCR